MKQTNVKRVQEIQTKSEDNMEFDDLSKDEKSLLLLFESSSVEDGGKVDLQNMSGEDLKTAKKWTKTEFIDFGRIKMSDIIGTKCQWVVLSNEAWSLAQRERRERFNRIYGHRVWRKTKE